MSKPTYQELERALQAREDFFLDFLGKARNIILWMDLEGKVTFINSYAAEFFCLQAEAALGRHVAEVILRDTPQARENVARAIRSHLARPQDYIPYELESVLHDGRRVWISWMNSTLLNRKGEPAQILCVGVDITERRRGEEDLRERERRFRAVADHTCDWECWHGPDGRLRWVNPAVEKVTGYTVEECLAQPDYPFFMIIEEDRGSCGEMFAKAMTGRTAGSGFPFRIRHRCGEIRWMSIAWQSIYDDDGEWLGLRAGIHDITEYMHASRALRRSEREYRELVENVRSIILRLDMDGRVTFFNEYARTFFGYREEEIIGRPVIGTIVPPEDSEGSDLAGKIGEVLQHPEEYSLTENENMRSDGSRVWVSWANRAVYGEDGGLKEILCIGIDITERRRAETALHESERKFRQIVEESVDGIILTDEEGRIVEWNRGSERIFGAPRTEAVGAYSWDILARSSTYWPRTEDGVTALRKEILDFLTTGTSELLGCLLEREIITPDGVRRTIQQVTSPIRTAKGFMGCSIVRDVTSLREAEERERLHRRQLIQADKMASLGILVSGVAHEINNPNNFILLNAEILANAWQSVTPILQERYEAGGDFPVAGIPYSRAHERIGRLITGLREGAERIEKIVAGLKTFTRLDSGEMTERIDLGAVLDSSLLIAGNLIRKSTSRFTVASAPDLPPVRGNFQRLEQVVLNLLTNACQALPSRDRGITVTTAADPEAGMVTLTVEDEGVGIAPEDMGHIFDPFFTTKRDSGGTGLGLSISYSIAQEHGGVLEIASEPGKGTRATVRLPVE